MPKGSFYFYFNNKEDFGLHVIDFFNNIFLEMLEPVFSNKSIPPVQRLEKNVDVRSMKLQVHLGHIGKPDISITADSGTWLNFLAKEKNIVIAMIQRKIKIKGPLSLMKLFAKCFPL